MMVVLDTDLLSLVQWGEGPDSQRLRSRLDRVPPSEKATTIITYEEQTRGWLAYVAGARTAVAQVKAYELLHRHLLHFLDIAVLRFCDRAAAEFQTLRKRCKGVGPMDLKIAAITLVSGSTLLSR